MRVKNIITDIDMGEWNLKLGEHGERVIDSLIRRGVGSRAKAKSPIKY